MTVGQGDMRNLGVINLPGVARSAPEARAFVRRTLPGMESWTMDDIALCVDELVANACEHTSSGRGGRVMVVVSASPDVLRVTVIDNGGADDKPCVRDESGAVNGRGLRLVEALSTGWGAHEALGGTAVWADFQRWASAPMTAPLAGRGVGVDEVPR